jgi:hypothetical protein
MNDDFLTRLHKTPRPEFAEALYERISRQPQPRLSQLLVNKLTFRNAAIAFMLLFLVAACVYAVTEKRWNKVGGIWLDVQKTLKLEFDPSEERTIEETPDYECLTVEEAREILRFDVKVSAWVPEGFTFDNRICGIDTTSENAGLYWVGADQYSGIQITLQDLRWFNMASQEYEAGSPSTMVPVAPRSYQEVQIHGQPAVLVRGDWEWPWLTEHVAEQAVDGKLELKWDKKRALQLYWVEGEVLYHLYTRAHVSVEDLIRMAESVQ